MKPYSLDLRQRIIDTYSNDEGTIRQIAQRFKVSISSVRRLIKRYLNTGSIAPKPYTGGNKPKLNEGRGSREEGLMAILKVDLNYF